MTEPVETELVARLREFVVSDELGNSDFSVCDEAADEIERLQAELARVRDMAVYMAATLECIRDGDDNWQIRAQDALAAWIAEAGR